MCGIAGVVSSEADPELEGLAIRMNNRLTHRGPDGEGVFRCPTGQASLAHRRLAIIDLATGAQPMSDQEGRTLTFNGEIYNYQALRAAHRSAGRSLRTDSDSEAILHEYALHGARVAANLRGMFAFAIWDQRARSLLLARDRFGKKPLFYAERGCRLYFASELKALLEVLPPPATDQAALMQYLVLGYIPGARTPYQGIQRLPPGSLLRWSAQGSTRVDPYWELPHPGPDHDQQTPEEWEKATAETLTEAVRLRMISDVPLGAFLSGGLDSSTIVALAVRETSRPFHTFSIRFEGSASPDAEAARDVSRLLGTHHHEETVASPTESDLLTLLRHLDEPFGDSSIIPTAAVSALARRHVTVSLSGDGGDEIFGGYSLYGHYRRVRAATAIPLVRRVARCMGDRLPATLPGRHTLNWLGAPEALSYAQLVSHFLGPALVGLVGAGTAQRATEEIAEHFRPPPDVRRADPIAAAQWIDAARTYLPGDILPKVDLASMRNSLEVRSPFLDHELAEQLAGLPSGLRMRGSRGKLLLRAIARRHLPARIIERHKIGFSVPLRSWMNGPMHQLLQDYVFDPSGPLSTLLDVAAARRLLPKIATDADARGAFTLLSLGVWAATRRP